MSEMVDTSTIYHNINQIQKKDWFKSYSDTANFTFNDNDKIKTLYITTGANTITVTLPTVADNLDRIIEIVKVDSGIGKITVDGEGAETINGSITKELNAQYDSVKIKSDGSEWFIISGTFTVKGTYYKEEKKDNGNQAIPNASMTTITDLSFSPPSDGLYKIDYMVSFFNSVQSDRLCYGSLFVGATERVEAISNIYRATATTYYTHALGSYIGDLSTTDTVVLKAYSLGGGNTNVVGLNTTYKATGWSIQKIGNTA